MATTMRVQQGPEAMQFAGRDCETHARDVGSISDPAVNGRNMGGMTLETAPAHFETSKAI